MTLTEFIPIYCGRSDGEVEIRSKKHGKEFNGPSNNQLDKVANPDDYYEPLDHNHTITLEWKRQLGGMLQREMRVQAQHPWFLMFFPENYRLYKHNKEIRDHTDAYLYGYPQGRKKRFRSAQEFFPHLLWLMEGKSEDYGDCACKNCAGEWVHKIEPLPGRAGFVPASKEVPQAKKEIVPAKKEPSVARKDNVVLSPKVVIPPKLPQQTNSIPRPPTKTPTPSAAPVATRPPSQPVLAPAPLPALKSKEQEIDAQYRRYIYRIGELVWFNRGTAWGLALVTKRDTIMQQGGRSIARFLVQPLSHPMSHPEAKIMASDDSLRPWLAWSAPGPTHRALTGKTYSSVDWKAVSAGQYGTGDAEVDGSILAAKQIDDSFSLISQLTNNTLTTGERTYLALFLGGEKIYVREPVRLRINHGQDVLVIHEIIEKLKPNSTNISLASVHVVGDVYRFVTLPYDPSNAKMFVNPHLPERMRADLEFRNSVTVPIKKVHSFWKLMQSSSRLSISDLKGRWYESSILLPTLRGNSVFASEIQRGEVSDVGDWINGRGDANGAAGKTGTRYRERLEAVGRAVPIGVRLGGPEESGEGGVEVPADRPSSNPQPASSQRQALPQNAGQGQRRDSTQNLGQSQRSGRGDGDISQYMDVDRMEE